MIVLVAGGRDYQFKRRLFSVLNVIDKAKGITKIIHGGAPGADTFAGEWAECYGVPVEVYPASWSYAGKGAGAARNARMLSESCPDIVVAFPGGPGTRDMIIRSILRERRIPSFKLIVMEGE